MRKEKKVKGTQAVRAQARKRSLPVGPGLFNPTRSVRFADRKKKANRKAARGRTLKKFSD